MPSNNVTQTRHEKDLERLRLQMREMVLIVAAWTSNQDDLRPLCKELDRLLRDCTYPLLICR